MSWTLAPRAQRDLRDLRAHVVAENPTAALALIDTLTAAFRLLDAYPLAGVARSELRPRLRSFAVGSYVIYYRPKRAGVEVARILHGRQDVHWAFPRRG